MYEQFISGITIKSKEDINKCDECYNIKIRMLNNIECNIEEIAYFILDWDHTVADHDSDIDEKLICTICKNEIKFCYNPKVILEKYV